MRRSALIPAAALVAGLALVGCSPEQAAESKAQAANAAVCLSLKGLGATIEGLQTGVTGTGDVTVSKAQEAVNQLDQAYEDVQSSVQKLGVDVSDQVLAAEEKYQQAQMQFEETVGGLDGDAKLSELTDEQSGAFTKLQSSYEELKTSLGCTD